MDAREWARQNWEAVKAFGEGNDIEMKNLLGDKWMEKTVPGISNAYLYRVKPESKIVPYSQEDAAFLVGRKAKNKVSCSISLIGGYSGIDGSISIGGTWMSFETLLENFLDVTDDPAGVPFGKKGE